MARTNATTTRVTPAAPTLLVLRVLRTSRRSASFVRVTLGGDDLARFVPLGFDQWFRLFLPVSDRSLTRLPSKLDTLAYVRYLAISKRDRPVLRNYTVRAFRPDAGDGAELDVDFVLHGSVADGTSGPAATWAQQCRPGDPVALLDEGIMFTPPDPGAPVVLVADETAVPAASAILESLPLSARGTAYLEVPDPDDVAHVSSPEGVEIVWLPRDDAGAVPGRAALAAAVAAPTDPASFAWVAGEQGLVAALRREWIARGVPKDAIRFCGYWRQSRH